MLRGMRQIRHPAVEQIELTEVMYALSDPVRVGIVRRLAQEARAMTCGELGGDRPKSSMSYHFKILRAAGLLETTVDGKEHWNTLRTDEMERRFPGLLKPIIKFIKSA